MKKMTHVWLKVIFCLFLTHQLSAQSYFRVEISNPTDVPTIIERAGFLELTFANPQIQAIFDNYTVTVFEKEFPMFPEEPGLMNIFFVDCDNETLADDLLALSYYSLVEHINSAIELAVPIDYGGNLAFNHMRIPQAWAITEGSPSVKIGVIDTQLPDLTLSTGADLECQIEYLLPPSVIVGSNANTHGCNVAKLAGATPNNGPTENPGSGAGYNCRLYYGIGSWTQNTQKFVARGARIINYSATTGCYYSAPEQLFINKLAEKGVVIVAAAGNGDDGVSGKFIDNGGGPVCSVGGYEVLCNPNYTGNANAYLYPASYDNVISVSGSYYGNDNLYYDPIVINGATLNQICPVPAWPNPTVEWNGTGPEIKGTLTLNDKVDVLCTPGFGFATSYAAPIVSGIVGLMLSVNPKLEVNEVIEILNSTGVDIHNMGINPNMAPGGTNNEFFQNGNVLELYKLRDIVTRINAEAAVIEAKARYDVLVAALSGPALYTKQTTGAHTDDGVTSRKINWVDIDNDNDLDLYNGVNQLSPSNPQYEFQMYENLCVSATNFVDIEIPGLDTGNEALGTIGWGDFDNNGTKDLLTVSGAGEIYLYDNNNNGTSFVPNLVGTITTTDLLRGSQIADFNNDGNLDFIIAKAFASGGPSVYVFEGNGTGSFTAHVGTSDLYTSLWSIYGISVGDIDGDGNPDLSTTGWANGMFHVFYGDGNFEFTESPLDPLPYSVLGSYGGNLIDYDNDGDLDIFHFSYPRSVLLNNIGNKKFIYVTDVKLVTEPTLPNGHATWGDYDNDGDLDVYTPNLGDKVLYLNCDGVTFEKADFEITNSGTESDHESMHAAFGDADNDGDLDLYVNSFFNNDLNNYLYENDVANSNTNSWVTLKLEGVTSNRDAVGAIVRASITDFSTNPDVICRQMRHVQTNEGIPHDVYFGFNNYAGTITLDIEWPSGVIQTITGVAVNNRYKIHEVNGIVDIGCACTEDLPTGTEISGTVGFDLNQDCNCDDDDNQIMDYPLNSVFVQIEEDLGGGNTGSTYLVQSDPLGDYSMLVPDANYIITPIIGGTAYDVSDNCGGNPANLPPDDYTITVPPSWIDLDFCLQSSSCDFTTTVYPVYQAPGAAPCPTVDQDYCMTVVNNGMLVADPVFVLQLDPGVTIVSVNSPCGVVAIDNVNKTVTVSISGPFGPQETCTFCATVTVYAPLGNFLTTTGTVNGTCVDTEDMQEFVNCALDPNDKLLVNPQSCGPENNVAIDEMLIYRVRFQNEGNAAAVNVVIKDMLDDVLDLTTFQLLSSSHTVTNVSVLPGDKLILEMNGIQLPAESVDPLGSQGYVLFGIKAKPGTAEGTVVDNVASIYFDLNAAVVTNMVSNTLRAYPQPDVQFSWLRSCASLDMSYDFSYTGVTPDGATYFWDFGPNASPSTSTSANPTGIVFSTAGIEQVTLTVLRYGCDDALTQDVEVTSPIGCNGNPNKVAMCDENGNTICVSINAVSGLLNSGNFCVGSCENRSMIVTNTTESSNDMHVFPNPSSAKFNVEIDNSIVLGYKVVNFVGQEILQSDTDKARFTIDLSNVKSGVYILMVNTGNGVITRRLEKF